MNATYLPKLVNTIFLPQLAGNQRTTIRQVVTHLRELGEQATVEVKELCRLCSLHVEQLHGRYFEACFKYSIEYFAALPTLEDVWLYQ